MAVIANPLAGPSPLRDVIDPQFHQNNFPAEVHIKADLGLKLDKGLYSLSPVILELISPHDMQMTKFVGWP